ncbi:PASTA domain-containing protein [Pseudoclavibacter chungangensis]|uniref:PASTA domain-containing protein n=1 Tax=Pseudoclavibacter chungangensis TaxID=587635 RepID=A0A7J5BR38_9MICO|nr:transglycosylase domain-containing protein [Pseudoclavibacter chungangensis]KAB1656761.1 PASTA domain-containing protein [Pseudoclavibacter chungangensis]NYJ67776.1 membrane peptidoglycan carboxypeptidase [Pseudoclavibacter chungangensis]
MSAPNTTPATGSVLANLLGVLGMSGIAGVLVAAMVTPLIAVLGVTANSSIKLFEDLPSYLEIGALQQKTELYANQGGQPVKFAEFYAQNRESVSYDQISPNLVNAAVATEDPRFYEHGGVDVISAARAMLMSVMSDSGAGASTITMQYVRNVRVQTAENIPDPTEREIAYEQATEVNTGRKLQEMRLAIGVDKEYSKEEILQGYLNIALFGGTIYGVESAAQYYFGKSAADVTLPEAASLIAMVQEPNAYRLDIEENIPNNQVRRDYVLMRMLDEGKITQEEHDEAVATPVTPNITPSNHGCQNAGGNAQYFCDYVRNVVLNNAAFGETQQERSFNLQTKGYQIYTTLDLDLQDSAQATMNANVPATSDALQLGSGATMVEAGTGKIKAMVQNTTFNETDQTAPGETSVNYNTDYDYGGSTGFQVGSTYKIFTLAEWLATGHSLNSAVNGANRAFNLIDFKDSCNGSDGGTWSPGNDGGQKVGNITALQATVQSVNTAYVAMAQQLDQCRIRDTAMALGAHRADGQMNESNPAAILGTNQIAPLSMATAVAGLANNGISCSPIAIESITLSDEAKTAVDVPPSTCQQAVSSDTAAGVNSAMQAVVSGGTASASNTGTGIPMTGKTGSTDDYIQTWMVGATTKVGLAVWVGNVEGNVSLMSLGMNTIRHTLFRNIMTTAMGMYGGDAFTPPGASATKPDMATIPDLAGQTTEQAQATLEGLGFSVAIGNPVSSAHPAGTVASTLPSANTSVQTGTTVTINPSSGVPEANNIAMPDLAGMTSAEAQSALSAAGFSSGTILEHPEASSTVPAGQIIRSDPPAGSQVSSSSDVRIYVSTG